MQQTEVDLRDILAILRRQRRLIVLTLALMIGMVSVYLVMVTPIYRATTLVQIETGGSNLLDPGASGGQQSAVLNSLVDSEV
ncbi:MAG: Wzz/FepE/Etk N-terminal domain-containing protein, partial [Paracoccaceae bacterium]|nr:Wzz/FepE/Etk N-terminal domain-containing protein [Paracoccaceae bacterium]